MQRLLYRYGKVDIRVLKELLGHSIISTTEIYTHFDNQQLQTLSIQPTCQNVQTPVKRHFSITG